MTKTVKKMKGIKMYLNSEEHIRITTRTLHKMRIAFHTYPVEGKRTARVVIKGVHEHMRGEAVKEELNKNSIRPTKITRMQ